MAGFAAKTPGESGEQGGLEVVLLVPVAAYTDINGDGVIDEGDYRLARPDRPWFWWINDNDSSADELTAEDLGDLEIPLPMLEMHPHYGDVHGDQGVNADNLNDEIDGLRDLIDFFPLRLEIRALLQVYPPEDYDYHIVHSEAAINYCELPLIDPASSSSTNGLRTFLTSENVGMEAIARGLKSSNEEDGHALSPEFLQACADGMGILLLEGLAESSSPLELHVSLRRMGGEPRQRKVNVSILDLRLAQVDELIWQVDLTQVVEPDGEPGPLTGGYHAAWNNQLKDQWFIFCHGYNVSPRAARGWNAEMFKRLYHYGSRARFLGVIWQGNRGQIPEQIPLLGGTTPNYWQNVFNAFATAPYLANAVNALPGSKSGNVIAAHSLGNVMVSSAFCDFGMQVDTYFLFNAAVAREAYFAGHADGDQSLVSHPSWRHTHAAHLWASNYGQLFTDDEPADGRVGLTWRGRFASLLTVTQPMNFYSSAENVLMPGAGPQPSVFEFTLRGQRAWIAQEMQKGSRIKAIFTGQKSGGWALNPNHWQNGPPEDPELLKENPFFLPFTMFPVHPSLPPEWGNPHGPYGSHVANNSLARAFMLAHDVPALSQPAGGTLTSFTAIAPDGSEVEDEDRNIDMMTQRPPSWLGAWKHGDMKSQRIERVYPLFNKIVEDADLAFPENQM